MIYGRAAELGIIDQLLSGARSGRSGALVVRGAPGIGKSALLEYAAAAAAGFPDPVRVIRGTGIEFEAELPFAGLHALLYPVLDRLTALPAPQATALRAAFGLTQAESGDRFMVGLAVLSLLAELAEEGPLLCVIDDAQWWDRTSTEALMFAARRLTGEGVLLLLGARENGGDHALAGLPDMRLWGLDREAATALLAERNADLAANVRSRILAETDGNPLALIELPAALTPEQRAGEALPLAFHLGALPLTARLQNAFGAQVHRLPALTQALLLVAAFEETGDVNVILTASQIVGAGLDDLDTAERSGLLHTLDGSVTFRHPLARAAVIQSAPLNHRLGAHRALADALGGAPTGAPSDAADRRAWHLAAASTGPDEAIAAGLEQAAHRARSRAGYAAQTTALERAAELTPDLAARANRLTTAAEAATNAGELQRAASLARRAGNVSTDALLTARIAHVQATVEFEHGSPLRAARILIEGAGPLSGSHPDKAAAMLMEAVRNTYFSGDPELGAEAAARLVEIGTQNLFSQALVGLSRLSAGDPVAALPPMRALAEAARRSADFGPGERLIAGAMGMMTGDDEASLELFEPLVADARAGGLVGWLPNALEHLAIVEFFTGRHQDALVHAEEGLSLAESTDQPHRADHLRCVLAWSAATSGDEERCRRFAEPAIVRASARGIVRTVSLGAMSLGLLELVQGRHERVLDRLESASRGALKHHLGPTTFAPDQIEAAVRSGQPGRAAEPLARFESWAYATEQPWARAVALRCQALLAQDEEAERLFAEAVTLHGRGGRLFERARTELLYGEWLRRARRKAEARTQLRSALEAFERMGAVPWADRARAELRAAGEVAPRATDGALLDRLTPQELQVVRLAAQGLSNRDIAAQLFLSPRTIGYHLYKAYPKLGITARGELAKLLV